MSDTADTKKTQGSNGNTNNIRARNWCFTLNNYTKEDIKSLQSDSYQYLFQEEKGENGTQHLQGVIFFKNARSFGCMKKLHNKAHWEVCINKPASIRYCSKEDTRNGDIYSNFKYQTQDTVNTIVPKKKLSYDEVIKNLRIKTHLKELYEKYYDEWLVNGDGKNWDIYEYFLEEFKKIPGDAIDMSEI